ncbi:hypothetical protein ABID16_001231 [Rhizobium aquaticum]|uniref:DUF2059 domain-containing protein n=1 Tax=Rhizobium aquaticum TaxID=1549636 RepID=A0ABV2IXU3_9HYPH
MLKFAAFGRVAAAALIASSFGFATVSRAAEVTDEQLKAAYAAIKATGATVPFDSILPNIAEQMKAGFIQASPNYQDIISSTVDAEALALAARRGDLEKESATIYAKSFTTDELNAIANFFNSDVGKKFLKDVPLANRELFKAADIWSAGIQRDLSKSAGDKLEKIIGDKIKAGQAPAPLADDAVEPQTDTAPAAAADAPAAKAPAEKAPAKEKAPAQKAPAKEKAPAQKAPAQPQQ